MPAAQAYQSLTMPRDGRTLKRSKLAQQKRQGARKWLERMGEAGKAYNRATAALSRSAKNLESARKVLEARKAEIKNQESCNLHDQHSQGQETD